MGEDSRFAIFHIESTKAPNAQTHRVHVITRCTCTISNTMAPLVSCISSTVRDGFLVCSAATAHFMTCRRHDFLDSKQDESKAADAFSANTKPVDMMRLATPGSSSCCPPISLNTLLSILCAEGSPDVARVMADAKGPGLKWLTRHFAGERKVLAERACKYGGGRSGCTVCVVQRFYQRVMRAFQNSFIPAKHHAFEICKSPGNGSGSLGAVFPS